MKKFKLIEKRKQIEAGTEKLTITQEKELLIQDLESKVDLFQ